VIFIPPPAHQSRRAVCERRRARRERLGCQDVKVHPRPRVVHQTQRSVRARLHEETHKVHKILFTLGVRERRPHGRQNRAGDAPYAPHGAYLAQAQAVVGVKQRKKRQERRQAERVYKVKRLTYPKRGRPALIGRHRGYE